MGKIPLFNESDQDEEESVEFKTNRSYAKHYDEFRKKEILGQLKNLETEETSSSSEDETTDEEVVDPEFDKEFFRTLAYLKRSDPAKYKEKHSFFENVKPVEQVALERRKKKEKPMTLKDYERKVILEKGGVFEDEDENLSRQIRAESPSLVQQQEHIKDEIKRALSKIDTDDEEEKVSKGGLLKERSKTKKETEQEQVEYLRWLADRKLNEAPSDDVKPLKPLKEFWNSSNLSKEDAFLKDYILNKRFVDSSGDIPAYEDIVATSEDEEELEKQEEYERQYNFRFEEPDPEFIKRYPRNVEESVRIERNKRKEQRQALKERKQREKEQKKRQLEELKAIKLQEIREKIQQLKEISATENMVIEEKDLESDFDPDEHDRRMQQMFDDDYYGIDEGDQKPEFPDLDEELGIENYDRDKFDVVDQQRDGPHCEDEDFVMDADYEDHQKKKKSKNDLEEELLEITGGKKKKKGKRISKFTEMLRKEKPLFDPEDEKTYGEYIDEYYKLDYEDIIGDTPCRFRYVETVPNDFGLSIEEILRANTRELNRWASVKKTVQIRPKYSELSEIEVYKRKAQNEALKRKILPSLFSPQEESDEDDEIRNKKVKSADVVKDVPTEAETVTKNLKKKKNKSEGGSTIRSFDNIVDTSTTTSKKIKAKLKKHEMIVEDKQKICNDTPEDLQVDTNKTEGSNKTEKRKRHSNQPSECDEGQVKKKKRHDKTYNKHNTNTNLDAPMSNVSDSRLRAFGINPRKFYNKLKYGPTANVKNGHLQRSNQDCKNKKESFKNKKKWRKKFTEHKK